MICPQSPLPTPNTLGIGSVGQTSSFFSKRGHVAYQIKENNESSNMLANILPTVPPSPLPTLGMGPVGQN